MARGGFPGMGMGGNMQQLARQAQKLQQQMAKKQEELEGQLEAKMERWMYLNELKEKIDAQ